MPLAAYIAPNPVIFIITNILPEFSEYKTQIYGFLTALILLVTTSFIDDRKQISPQIRLIIQSLSALIVIYTGTYIEFIINPFTSFFPESANTFHASSITGGIITFLWIIGFINATNWSDGIPNLTLSSGIIASFSLGVLSFLPMVQQNELGLLCFVFFAILFPYIFANLNKTRFILGDSGSMIIGFCLAVFSLFSGGKMATLLIAMSIPIFDSIYVVISRILEKKSPLKGGDVKHKSTSQYGGQKSSLPTLCNSIVLFLLPSRTSITSSIDTLW
jgi:UDP-GlcNAc:undecaprenyl-phosphate GlcNAc-1-phosphate transferase